MEKAQESVAKNYVNEEFPPVLILHGTKDKTVACEQSVQLFNALREAGKEATLYLVRGSDHGGQAFWSDEAVDIYDAFIKKCLDK